MRANKFPSFFSILANLIWVVCFLSLVNCNWYVTLVHPSQKDFFSVVGEHIEEDIRHIYVQPQILLASLISWTSDYWLHPSCCSCLTLCWSRVKLSEANQQHPGKHLCLPALLVSDEDQAEVMRSSFLSSCCRSLVTQPGSMKELNPCKANLEQWDSGNVKDLANDFFFPSPSTDWTKMHISPWVVHLETSHIVTS